MIQAITTLMTLQSWRISLHLRRRPKPMVALMRQKRKDKPRPAKQALVSSLLGPGRIKTRGGAIFPCLSAGKNLN